MSTYGMESSSERQPEPILARLDEARYVERENEPSTLDDHSARALNFNLLLLGSRHVGKTEILLRTFDSLFRKGDIVVPVYCSVRGVRPDFRRVARDFISQLLRQVVAFRLRDPRLLNRTDFPVESIARYADRDDLQWVRTLLDVLSRGPDLQGFFSAVEVIASQTGLAPMVMLDNVDRLWSPGAEAESDYNVDWPFVGSLLEAATRRGSAPDACFVLAGLERHLVEMLPPDEDTLEGLRLLRISRLPDRLSEDAARRNAAHLGVEISDSTIELMVQQLRGDLFYMRAVLDSAAASETGLKTFVDFERLYTAELLNGRIAHYLAGLFRGIAPGFHQQRALVETLRLVAEADGPIPLDAVVERIELHGCEPEALLRRLSRAELLNLEYGFVSPSSDVVAADYVRAVYRREIAGARPAVAGEELLRDKLKTSYRLMMSRFSRSFESQLVEVLSRFDFQNVPASLFDQEAFEMSYRAVSKTQIRRSLETEKQRIRLPQMVLVKDAGNVVEMGISWRLFIGGGFEGGIYSEANEVRWLVALINSREQVGQDVIARIDRLFRNAIRSYSNGDGVSEVRWYISKEGFTPQVLESNLDGRSRFSNYLQLELLHEAVVRPSGGELETEGSAEFELVIPIEDEAELIAARTVEQIARSADFDQEAINQIKTALIEACINAAEHSDSPDRRIYQTFSIKRDRLVITVRNKGIAFDFENIQPRPTAGVVTGSLKGSRGRGLQIIRALMDEVHFERTDEGSSLVMTKFLKRPEDQ